MAAASSSEAECSVIDAADARGPIDRSNWLITGRVLVGGFPRAADVTSLVSSGVKKFVCLQELHEPSTKPPYWTSTPEFSAPAESAPKFLHFPTKDGMDLKPDLIHSCVEAIVSELQDPVGVVYIHCHGGHGRTGVIAGCLLRRLFGMSGTEALNVVEKLHASRLRDGHGPSPETHGQRMCVQTYKRPAPVGV